MDDRSIRVLIVEDSRSSAMALKRLLAPFDLVGVARNGKDALRLQARLKPSVITMDIHLPDTNGLELTRQILARRKVPIVIISSLVSPERQGLVFEALQAGAYDVVAKSRFFTPDGKIQTQHKLIALIRAAAQRPEKAKSGAETRAVAAPAKTVDRSRRQVLAIGASTGGPAAIRILFEALGQDFPLPILVAQHMSDGFIEGFVRWLDSQTHIRTRIAAHDLSLEPSTAYFAPSGHHLTVGEGGLLRIVRNSGLGPSPSVNMLFHSVAGVYGPAAICLLLTGMGSDGAEGLLAAKQRRALTAAQDEQSAVIFGMPKEAIRLGATGNVLSLGEIGGWLLNHTRGIPAKNKAPGAG